MVFKDHRVATVTLLSFRRHLLAPSPEKMALIQIKVARKLLEYWEVTPFVNEIIHNVPYDVHIVQSEVSELQSFETRCIHRS